MSEAGALLVVDDARALAAAAAEHVAAELARALERAPRASLALSGGKTPVPAYERLAAAPLAWDRVDLFFADERCVPPDDRKSNYRLVREHLLDRLGAARPRVFRMEGERADAEAAARAYEAALPERIDVLVLGIGADAHTASLFPGGLELAERERRVVATRSPKPPHARITLAPRAIAEARSIVVLVEGEAKAEALARALEGPPAPERCPAQLARRGRWIVDRAAASLLARASTGEGARAPRASDSSEGTSMQIGMVGLGRMGASMARRLARAGHACVGHDVSPENVAALEREGIGGARSLEELVAALAPPRAVWVMVPAGAPTESVVGALGRLLEHGDVVIDGGNTHYQDDVRRARELAARGVHLVDVGTSGGVWGLERGYCLMIGGESDVVRRLAPIFRALAPGHGAIERTHGREGPWSDAEEGFLHCGPSGAGHFVKMVHNGIEYGLMQAYAEGLDILRHAASESIPSERRYALDLAAICELWRRGSVVSSWLLDLTAAALHEDPRLDTFAGVVADSGEGRWTIATAIEEEVPAYVLSAALYARFRSRRHPTFADKVLSAMRKGFGGHRERPAP